MLTNLGILCWQLSTEITFTTQAESYQGLWVGTQVSIKQFDSMIIKQNKNIKPFPNAYDLRKQDYNKKHEIHSCEHA